VRSPRTRPHRRSASDALRRRERSQVRRRLPKSDDAGPSRRCAPRAGLRGPRLAPRRVESAPKCPASTAERRPEGEARGCARTVGRRATRCGVVRGLRFAVTRRSDDAGPSRRCAPRAGLRGPSSCTAAGESAPTCLASTTERRPEGEARGRARIVGRRATRCGAVRGLPFAVTSRNPTMRGRRGAARRARASAVLVLHRGAWNRRRSARRGARSVAPRAKPEDAPAPSVGERRVAAP